MRQQNKNEAKKFLPKDVSWKAPSKLISILKLIIFILLLPVVIGNSYGLLKTLSDLDKQWANSFWMGVFIFFVIDLVILKLSFLYKKGQRIIAMVFRFFAPLVKFAPYVLPIYTILVLVCSAVFGFFENISLNQSILMFLAGFSIVLHLVYTADALCAREADFLRATHFFTFSLIYLFNLVILAFSIDRILPDFSFLEFFHNSCESTKDIYAAIFDQFFRLSDYKTI